MPVQKWANLSRKPVKLARQPGSPAASLMQGRGQQSHLKTETSQVRKACRQNEWNVRFSLNCVYFLGNQ
jgi:hypothetical protein